MSAGTEPYLRLIELIEGELELAAQGRLDELDAAVTERGRHLEQLPVPVPPDAEALLRRAIALHSRLMIDLQRWSASLEQRVEARQLARRLARSYAGGALDPAPGGILI